MTVTAANQAPCVELAESVLAALEALLATGGLLHMAAREPTITLNILPSDVAESPFTFERDLRGGRPAWELRCRPFDPFHLPTEVRESLNARLWDLLVDVLSHAFHLGGDRSLDALFGEERAPRRALGFTGSFVALGNVLGDSPRTRLGAWADPAVRVYPLRREQPWDAADRQAARRRPVPATVADSPPPAFDAGPPPDELADPQTVKHSEMAVASLIREPLWNAAKWMALGFGSLPDQNGPPVLALVFRNASPAAQIIAGWREEFGARDEHEVLRVSLIRGISRANRHAYRVAIGLNPSAALAAGGPTGRAKLVMLLSRFHTMEPTSGENLRRFLELRTQAGEYALTWGVPTPDHSDFRIAPAAQHILKRELHVRQAWEIGPGDWDFAAIKPDDDPVLPADRPTAEIPVLALLRELRAPRSAGRSAA